MTDARWVGTWTTTPALAEGVALAGPTIRMFPRTSIGGEKLRIRLSNAAGNGDLMITSVRVGVRGGAASVKAGTDRAVTFSGGSRSVKIPAGAFVISDPVAFIVPPLTDLSVSVYVPRVVPASFGVTGRYARQIHYLSPAGDFTGHEVMNVSKVTDDWLFLCGMDVQVSGAAGGVVAFGDSLTSGSTSSHDSHNRYTDQLARRLAQRGGRPYGVMNQGLGGNRLLHDGAGQSGIGRFERDVLGQPGVTLVIVSLGLNDIRNRRNNKDEFVTPDEMKAGLTQLAVRARDRGIKIFGATITPCEGEVASTGASPADVEASRLDVNDWLRTGKVFDGIVDFDAALRDPDRPSRLLATFDSGDHLHPNDAGYKRMADAIELSLFD
ncbi:MAG: SGNH/GDSL hydrolase family protein [Hyphomicrobiaceae bacterium]